MRRKQNTVEQDWLDTIQNIENIVSKKRIDDLIDKTVSDITKKTRGKNVAYSWSGGKDSIVLGYVCEKAGIKDSVFVYCNLEYKQFMNWINENKPSRCQMINTGQDIKWLADHPEMLFLQDSKIAAKWFKIVQHTGQEKYYIDHELDMICLGRRRADGNYVGKGQNFYTNKKGITRYSPIADWTHEDVLACIHYYDLPLPPIYEWKNGYLCGTHNWAARQWTGDIMNGWKEVYDIEPEIVCEASKYLVSAKEFLDGQTEKRLDR